MDDEYQLIGRFHGHIGPYAVLGYRMGQLANKVLGDGPKDKHVVVYTGTNPPVSCLIDGIQLASSCTLGKGNISVEDKGEARALFNNRSGVYLELSLADGLVDRINRSFKDGTQHELSEWIWSAEEAELFHIKEG